MWMLIYISSLLPILGKKKKKKKKQTNTHRESSPPVGSNVSALLK